MHFLKHYGSFNPPMDCGHRHRTCKGAERCTNGYGGHEETADVCCVTSGGERLAVEGHPRDGLIVQAGPSVSAEDLSALEAEGLQVILTEVLDYRFPPGFGAVHDYERELAEAELAGEGSEES